MMTDLQVLFAARKLLMDPKRWVSGSLAAINVETEEPCYCAIGAVGAACGVQWAEKTMYGVKKYLADMTKTEEIEDQWVRVSEILERYVPDEILDELEWADYESDDGCRAESVARGVYTLNDERGYEAVMALFSRAIQALVEAGSEQEVAVA